MKTRDKIILILISIITLGIYPLILFKKNKITKEASELSQTNTLVVNINKLKELLGTIDNLKRVENTHTKVKIFFKDKEKVQLKGIQDLKGISGIFISSDAITIIVGNSAELLKAKLM